MSDDVAIRVSHVSKTFKLPHEKQTSVKGLLISAFRRGRRSYERQQVLKDVSFEIKRGEFFGIVGRNGSGKSTLLKMLAGIYVPTSGSVQINGRLTPFIELGVGFNPELTGRENVYLNGALLGFNRKEMDALYDDIVSFAELEKFMDQKLKNYSSGMQVRLAFSIAIRAQSEILVLDEVLAVGDIAFQKKCLDYFEQLKRENRTVILVSHDMAAVEKHCTRALLINNGKVVDSGDPKVIAAKYRLLNLSLKKQELTESLKLVGKVTIDKVSINGGKDAVVGEKDKLTVNITYTSKATRNFVVAISIFRDSGEHVAYYDNREVSKTVGQKGKTYTTSCSFDAKQFLEGGYQVDVDLYDSDGIYLASKPDAVQFSVTQTSPAKAGLLNLQGEWKNHKS